LFHKKGTLLLTLEGNNSKGKVTVLGIDLAKNSFQLHGVDEKGNRDSSALALAPRGV
jgi:hypothetical protein